MPEMKVKPGDYLFWDEWWESTYTSTEDMVMGLDDGDEITMYRAKVIEPVQMKVVGGKLVPNPSSGPSN